MFRKASIVSRSRPRPKYLTGELDPEEPLIDPHFSPEDETAGVSPEGVSQSQVFLPVVQPPSHTPAGSSASELAMPTNKHKGSHRRSQQGRHSEDNGSDSARRWHRAGKAAAAAAALMHQGPAPQVHLPGNVQGIDLSRSPEEWAWLSSHYSAECDITCVDFSPDKVLMRGDITNATLSEFLQERRPAWSKVRWLSVDRLSWDVIQSLAIHYKLHPLAVEDVLHIPQRIKADFYEHFLYVSLTLITLACTSINAKAEPIRPATQVRSAVAAASSRARSGSHHVLDTLTSKTASATAGLNTSANAASTASRSPAASVAATIAHISKSGFTTTATATVHVPPTPTPAPPVSQVPRVSAFAAQQPVAPDVEQGHSPQGADDGGVREEGGGAGPSGVEDEVATDDEDEGSVAGEESEGGDLLASLPARRLGRTMSVSRPLGHKQLTSVFQSVGSNHLAPDSGNVNECEVDQFPWRGGGAVGSARLALERRPTLLPRGVGGMLPGRVGSSKRSATPFGPGAGGAGTGGAAAYSSEEGVPVHRQQVAVFVVDNNTIISIFEVSGSVVTRPLLQQLRDPHTLARDAGDASYLLCQLLDALADSFYPVVDAYSDMVEGYEARILGAKPQAGVTRELHLVQQDLATLRRTVLPSLHLVTALRTHASSHGGVGAWDSGVAGRNTARSTADGSLHPGGGGGGGGNHGQHSVGIWMGRAGAGGGGAGTGGAVAEAGTQVDSSFGPRPLVSPLTKTYLGDVQDHLTTVLDAVDSQIEACRDLIDLAFNLLAHGTNQSMQALTVVSVLFLPLTFLAGIYGMNFDRLPELHWEYGYVYFYGMCGIICLVFLGAMFKMGLMGS